MRLWFIALLIWFAMYAVLALTNVHFALEGIVMGVMAAIVAVLGFFDNRFKPVQP